MEQAVCSRENNMKTVYCAVRTLFLAFVVVAWTQAGFAQTGMTAVTGGSQEQEPAAVTLPEYLTPETVRELVSTLSDEQVRQLLLERLDAVARQDTAPTEPGRDVLEFLGSSFVAVGVLIANAVTGLFFLVDDAFRVGEYLEIDGTVGTVEKISVRSLQLRHHQGPVHTIPYGEIPKITNNSRDWVIVKLKFTVPFDADVNTVKKLFKQIGKDIMEAPYADDIIQTFKSQGVYDVNDVGIVVRGKFMAKPGKQWMIRKDVYARVQKIFSENGIEFARREVRVKMPETEEGADAAGNGTAAAAAEAAIAQQEEEMQAAAKPG